MRFVRSILAASLVLTAAALGCKSQHEEGVKSDYRSQWISVAADTKTTTDAANAVLEQDELKNVAASSTNVDGSAMGQKSDGTKVKVAVEKDGAGSKVSVTVGTMGDPALGASIARRVKDKAEAK